MFTTPLNHTPTSEKIKLALNIIEEYINVLNDPTFSNKKTKQSPQQRAKLRCCASCEWIYKGPRRSCPKCGFGSYGARFVYGDKAYKFKFTQEPWLQRKLKKYESELLNEIKTKDV